MRARCTLAQDPVSIFGNVFDLHAGHGAILALVAPKYKYGVRGGGGRSHAKVRATHRRNGVRWSAYLDLRDGLAPENV